MPKESNKPRFEPPPWEREAFDRFEQERSRQRAVDGPAHAPREPSLQPATESTTGVSQLERVLPQVRASQSETSEPVPEARDQGTAPELSEARIDSMLIRLRSEEPRLASTNMALINGVCALLAILGLFVIVQAAVLSSGVGASETTTTLIAGTMSLVVFMTGLGLLVGAGLLFRKYHR